MVVWNSLAHKRTDLVTARLDTPLGAGVRVLDADGAEVPALVEHGGRSVTWLARDVPSLGWRAYRLVASDAATGWKPLDGNEIANEHYRLRVDPARGGGVSSLVEADSGRELIADGAVGNELAVYDEYSAHPQAGEGPWHLLPKGPVVTSSAAPAELCGPTDGPLGERLVVRGRIGDVLALHPDGDAVARSWPGWTARPRSTSSPVPTGWCGCAGRVRCRARCRSARSAMPSSDAASG